MFFFNTQDVNSHFPIPIQVVFEISYVEIIATCPIEQNISDDRPAAIYVWQFKWWQWLALRYIDISINLDENSHDIL